MEAQYLSRESRVARDSLCVRARLRSLSLPGACLGRGLVRARLKKRRTNFNSYTSTRTYLNPPGTNTSSGGQDLGCSTSGWE